MAARRMFYGWRSDRPGKLSARKLARASRFAQHAKVPGKRSREREEHAHAPDHKRERTGPNEGGEENDAAQSECEFCNDVDLPASLGFVSQGVDFRLEIGDEFVLIRHALGA
jgi:hypothetical protein